MTSSLRTIGRNLLLLVLGYAAFSGPVLGNASGINTNQARTAAPVAVNLAGVAASSGSSLSFAQADHVHSITGVVPGVNGGLGAALPTCSGSQMLTCNGTTCACATVPLPAGGNPGQSVVNNGSGTGGWDYSIPTPGFGRRFSYWQVYHTGVGGGLLIQYGVSTNITHSGGGTQTNGSDTSYAASFESLGPSQSGTLSTGDRPAYPGHRPRVRGHFKTPNSLTNLRWRFGYIDGNVPISIAATTSTVAEATKYINLVYDNGVNVNFILESSDGTNRSGVSTGLAVATNTHYWIDLDWTVAGTLTVRIYVGSPTAAPTVVSKSSNLDTSATAMCPFMGDINLSGSGTISGFSRMAFAWDYN